MATSSLFFFFSVCVEKVHLGRKGGRQTATLGVLRAPPPRWGARHYCAAVEAWVVCVRWLPHLSLWQLFGEAGRVQAAAQTPSPGIPHHNVR